LILISAEPRFAAAASAKATRRRAETDRRSTAPKRAPVSAIDFSREAAELPVEIWDQPP